MKYKYELILEHKLPDNVVTWEIEVKTNRQDSITNDWRNRKSLRVQWKRLSSIIKSTHSYIY